MFEGIWWGNEYLKKIHPRGWRFSLWRFTVCENGKLSQVEVKARDYDHAKKHMDERAKRDGFQIVRFDKQI